MTTVAVVGGTGFLGRHVVRALQNAGFSVSALSRRNGFDALHPNPESLGALRGMDAVVNLAGIKREDSNQTFQGVHVELLRTIISTMKTAGIRRLIHVSVVVARPAPDLPYHDTAPFTVTRLRPLLAKTNRVAPFNLRLFAAPRPVREITGTSFWLLLASSVSALALVFGVVSDRWMGMTVAMGLALAGAMFIPSVRHRLRPSIFGIATGVVAGVVLYGITLAVLGLLSAVWPEWETAARTLCAWRTGHSPPFIGATLVLIVLAEEALWRGVVARFLMERCGRLPGIVFAAAIYALAHWAAFNPLLLLAAFGCGLYWGWLYAATDDLVSPGVSHLLWDVLLLFLFPVVR